MLLFKLLFLRIWSNIFRFLLRKAFLVFNCCNSSVDAFVTIARRCCGSSRRSVMSLQSIRVFVPLAEDIFEHLTLPNCRQYVCVQLQIHRMCSVVSMFINALNPLCLTVNLSSRSMCKDDWLPTHPNLPRYSLRKIDCQRTVPYNLPRYPVRKLTVCQYIPSIRLMFSTLCASSPFSFRFQFTIYL